MVHLTGLEPAHLSAQDPKSCVSANSTTGAYVFNFSFLALRTQAATLRVTLAVPGGSPLPWLAFRPLRHNTPRFIRHRRHFGGYAANSTTGAYILF